MNKLNNISDALIRPQGQFLRSANLERDFYDPQALESFVPTDLLKNHLYQIADGLSPQSGRRAWRITGDYGAGKSTFALFLAHCLSGGIDELPSSLRKIINYENLESHPNLFPILVTGNRENIATAIQRAIKTAVDHHPQLKITGKFAKYMKTSDIEPLESVELLHHVRKTVVKQNIASGILLIVDELGKLLEYTALNPEQTDVYTWQLLAEDAMRSKDIPFVLVGLLHQGFSAYASQLGMEQKREWEKVAGRFSELVLHHPTSQLAQIVSGALNVNIKKIPEQIKHTLEKTMEGAIEKGWYGRDAHSKEILAIATKLYPLDPFVLPVLSRLLHAVGQNERSLFSFMFGGEPFSLEIHTGGNSHEIYRLSHLYDYFRSNFSRELEIYDPVRWSVLSSMVDAFPQEDQLTVSILKTIGLLNMVNGNDMLPTSEIISWACIGEPESKTIQKRLKELQSETGNRAVYDRGSAGGLCLWSHTSVDLHEACKTAKQAINGQVNLQSLFNSHLNFTYRIVARKHYIETGNLRSLEVKLINEKGFNSSELTATQADGIIVVLLYTTPKDKQRAKQVAMKVCGDDSVFAVVPALSLSELQPCAEEVEIWEYVRKNTLELNSDQYAREIVSKRYHAALKILENKLNEAIGLSSAQFLDHLQVFYNKEHLPITTQTQFLRRISDAMDNTFPNAPIVRNELINRNTLSPAAAGARMRLIEGLLERRHFPLLGMNPDKKPPEMSMYKSILEKGNLHKKIKDEIWDVIIPEKDELNISSAIAIIDYVLADAGDQKVSVNDIIQTLKKPPYGISFGLAPLLLAIFCAINENQIAFYEDGGFIPQITGADFQRLMKKPETFSIQRCRIEGVKSQTYCLLAQILQLPEEHTGNKELLDIVRPLCVFTADLPKFVQNTKKLSKETISVRDSLLAAEDPIALLFTTLPESCGISRISEHTSENELKNFVGTLQNCLNDLRQSYIELRERVAKAIAEGFSYKATMKAWRQEVAVRAGNLFSLATEPKLKAFCFRLSDQELSEDEWIESIGSLVQAKPLEQWTDNDESLFATKLADYCARFIRTEATCFEKGESNEHAVRICLTSADGDERAQVVLTNKQDTVIVEDLRKQIAKILTDNGNKGMIAATQALWEKLPK